MDGTEYGVLDMSSLLAGFGDYIDWNEIDARWVARIAQTFRRPAATAPSSGCPMPRSTPA